MKFDYGQHVNPLFTLLVSKHGCQNPDLNSTILQFYDLTCPKRSESFKNFCDCSGLVGSYDSDDPK